MFVAPRSSNELRSLDYNKTKVNMFPLFPSHSATTSPLNYHPSIFQLAILDKCKAWTTSTMVMFGAR